MLVDKINTEVLLVTQCVLPKFQITRCTRTQMLRLLRFFSTFGFWVSSVRMDILNMGISGTEVQL